MVRRRRPTRGRRPLIGSLAGPLGRPVGGQHHRGRDHAAQVIDRFLGFLTQGFQPGALVRIDLNGEGDVPILGLQALDHAGADDVLAAVRVDHFLERIENLLFANPCHP